MAATADRKNTYESCTIAEAIDFQVTGDTLLVLLLPIHVAAQATSRSCVLKSKANGAGNLP